MVFSLKDRHVLVTGSTDGLGKATALQMAKEGARVILHGRSKEKVEKALAEIKKISPLSTGIICDLENPEEIGKAFSKIEKLDILILIMQAFGWRVIQ